MEAASRSPSGGIRKDLSPSSSVSGPEMPKETTGPNSGSSIDRTAIGTPGGAFFWTTRPACSGDPTMARSVCQASFISSAVSTLRHTCARSGRSRRCSAVALSTTSQPSFLPTFCACRSEETGIAGQSSMPYDASRAVSSSESSVAPSGCFERTPPTSARATPVSRLPGTVVAPSGVRSHTAYSTTLASARTAPSTAGYDGTDPRPAVEPGHVGDAQQLGHALRAEERRDERLVGLLPHGREHVGDLVSGDVERRDVHRDHGVDLGVVDGVVERVLEVLGRRLGTQGDLLVDDQADRGGGVGGEKSEGVGVADDRDTTAARQGLVREQLGDVEHVVERVDLDDAGLTEHRVDGLRRRGDLADRVAHRHTLGGATRAHRHDRLAQRDATSDPRELARVTDRLEVHHHDLGRVVLLPVLEEVVAGDVGAVAGADERRETEATVLDLLEDRGAERTGLAEEPGTSARRHQPREGGVELDAGVGVDDAERIGADQPQAVGPRQADELALPLATLLPRLGEAGGDDDQPVHALGRAVEDDVGDRRRPAPRRSRRRRHRGCRRRTGTPAGRRPRPSWGSRRRPDR